MTLERVNSRRLECKVKSKRRSFLWTYYLGFYLTIILSIIDVTIAAVINRDESDAPNQPFVSFQVFWIVLLVIYILKASLHLYSIFLIWRATRIMQRIAKNQGNPESTKDIRYITAVGFLCFVGFSIYFLGYLAVTILNAFKLIDSNSAITIRCFYMAATSMSLFAAYIILINIFWTYVININQAMQQ